MPYLEDTRRQSSKETHFLTWASLARCPSLCLRAGWTWLDRVLGLRGKRQVHLNTGCPFKRETVSFLLQPPPHTRVLEHMQVWGAWAKTRVFSPHTEVCNCHILRPQADATVSLPYVIPGGAARPVCDQPVGPAAQPALDMDGWTDFVLHLPWMLTGSTSGPNCWHLWGTLLNSVSPP